MPLKMQGSSMLEVLVTIIILTIGLTGLASLQAFSINNNSTATMRFNANIYASEMMERLKANRSLAAGQFYNLSLTTPASFTPSTMGKIENIDRVSWLKSIDSSLLDAHGAISCTTDALCTVTIQWNEPNSVSSTAKKIVLEAQL